MSKAVGRKGARMFAMCLFCEQHLSGWQRRFCSRRCSALYHGARRRIIEKDTLATLYVLKNLPLTEVAKRLKCCTASVHSALKRFGIPRRKYTVRLVCVEPGCNKPAWKRKKSSNGRWFGVRCHWHTHLWMSFQRKKQRDRQQQAEMAGAEA